MKQAELIETLVTCFHARLGIAIEGDPGGGKTQCIIAATRQAGMDLIIDHPAISDPTDYKGLPVMQKDGGAKFAPIGLIAQLLKVKRPTVVFADDFGQATHMVQAAFMQLIHGGRLNDIQLPMDLIVWVLATNSTKDRAAVNALLEPVKSRFHSLVRLDVDVTDWVRWAYSSSRIDERVIAFIRFKPEHLNAPAPSREFKNSPNPRTVEHASDLLKAGILHKEMLAGACGEAWALDFLSFLRVYQDLPSIEGILLEPTNAKVPTTVGARWAVSSSLVKRASQDNLPRILTYMGRLSSSAGSRDFEIMTVKDILKVNAAATQCAAFGEWAARNDDVMS